MSTKNPANDISNQVKEKLFSKMGALSTQTEPSSEKYYAHYHEQHIKDIEHRRKQRERLDNRVFLLLLFQVVFLVTLILFQGFKLFNFSLNEWAFGIFVNGSLIQTYLLARYIAADLYTEPKSQ